MLVLITLVHIAVCVFLIIVVLLQSGKAADLAGAFGGMGSQTAFGPRGSATLLSRATTISAVLFMVTSLSLSILATRQAGLATTVLEGAPQKGIPVQQQPPPQRPGVPKSIDVGAPGSKPVPIPLEPAQPPAKAPAAPAKK
ncbi:MAG: preprotein translocase subunit SecG [Acidobacteriia bacterium]|nr:preprotein translocase subunit SecG [Terriglobia bacterium]